MPVTVPVTVLTSNCIPVRVMAWASVNCDASWNGVFSVVFAVPWVVVPKVTPLTQAGVGIGVEQEAPEIHWMLFDPPVAAVKP